ncbi:hypothetical protein DM02DRAFT_626142 [Periconia macrospinosa]|uniref:Uncharacterized protein n=1 Tax=Periconia macrospinosa TaxID=97972 RepID=A0A2V1DXM3_9PLEO|nr:hypothetical protein DM02DRAFT_626142 [Periconia macrospinosa]
MPYTSPPFPRPPFTLLFPPTLYAVTALYFGPKQGSSSLDDIAKDPEWGLKKLSYIVPILGGVVAPVNSQILLTRCDFIVSSVRDWGLFGLNFGLRIVSVRHMEPLPPSSTTGEGIVKPARRRWCVKNGGDDTGGDRAAAWEVICGLIRWSEYVEFF